MIPLVLASIGFGVAAYFAERKLRHKKVTLGGILAAALVSGATGFFGGPILNTLGAAGLFAAEGGIAGEVENDVAKPVVNFFSGIFSHHSSTTPTDSPPTPTGQGGDGGYAGSSGSAAITPVTSGDNTVGARYVVQPGDTFYSIARRAGVSENSLRGVNPSVGPDMQIRAGQTLNIPCANINSAGPGAPKSPGCVAAIERAFSQNPSPANGNQPGE
jgi:LysM repeat protein